MIAKSDLINIPPESLIKGFVSFGSEFAAGRDPDSKDL
jgi:hypothetical protein